MPGSDHGITKYRNPSFLAGCHEKAGNSELEWIQTAEPRGQLSPNFQALIGVGPHSYKYRLKPEDGCKHQAVEWDTYLVTCLVSEILLLQPSKPYPQSLLNSIELLYHLCQVGPAAAGSI